MSQQNPDRSTNQSPSVAAKLSAHGNVALRLTNVAKSRPQEVAIAVPLGSHRDGTKRAYKTISFEQLDQESSSIAAGLQNLGMKPGMRIVMLVPFNADFITLVFGLFKAGAVIVLIDPGMGRGNLVRCLEAAQPEGFVGIPAVHLVRSVLRWKFPKAKFNVTVGRKFGLPRLPNLDDLRTTTIDRFEPCEKKPLDPAAIIFTTGSTGPPKGVLYTHQTFNQQIDQLVHHYGIEPGGCDLSGFPLFGLFNAVMGTTTIIPDMNPIRPADVDPPRLLDAIDQWKVNQAFGSPSLWTAVGRYCQQTGRKVPSLKRVLSAGAPVPPRVLQWVRDAMAEDGVVFTPYGATEALPVASIESREVLEETSLISREGGGTCVGRKFQGIDWKVIQIDDQPIVDIAQAAELPPGSIGELMVSGPVVSVEYVTRTDQNAYHKVRDGDRVWHRMGDLGYLDAQGRFWFVGRKTHRVRTSQGDMFTIPCEAIFNTHPSVHRSALVGIGEIGKQQPAIVIETWPEKKPADKLAETALLSELAQLAKKYDHTRAIEHILLYPGRLPTDIRHNAKIFREKLAPWAEKQIAQAKR